MQSINVFNMLNRCSYFQLDVLQTHSHFLHHPARRMTARERARQIVERELAAAYWQVGQLLHARTAGG